MAKVKVLARGWLVEVQNDALTWVTVLGLKSLTFDGEKNDADTTSFDDNGWMTHQVASRGRSLGLEGFYLEDQSDKTRDPGQVIIENLSDAIGQDSLGVFRLTSPAGTVRNFDGSVNVDGVGGGNDDPTNWNFEITVSGEAAFADVPVTAITATPDTLALNVGDVSALMGSLITFAPTAATNKTLTYAITAGGTNAAVTAEGRVVGLAVGAATLTITPSAGTAETIAITVS